MAVFGWLDGDDAHRAAMLEVVKMFEDTSTIDELGLGSIRDTFSNTFFKGTSTLHTRLRYMLFIPWLVQDVARHKWPVPRALDELRAREVTLINALLAGGESENVIGREAGRSLKRMPSDLYWASLGHLGIRRWQTSKSGYFRLASQQRAARRHSADDPLLLPESGMATLPTIPSTLMDSTTFALTSAEAEFLRQRIASDTRGSLFAWLVVQHPASEAPSIWTHEAMPDFPPDIAQLVELARIFHYTARGTGLLYNVLMARVTDAPEQEERFVEGLAQWRATLEAQQVHSSLDPTTFWDVLLTANPRIRPSTQLFLNQWWEITAAGDELTPRAAKLLQDRELFLKRGLARLAHPEARSTWSPGVGTGAYDFRWGVAKRHLNDIATGLEA